jgi:hypothetical protein
MLLSVITVLFSDLPLLLAVSFNITYVPIGRVGGKGALVALLPFGFKPLLLKIFTWALMLVRVVNVNTSLNMCLEIMLIPRY